MADGLTVDYLNLIVTHPFLMLWAGQLLHMLKEVKEVETRAPEVTIGAYIRRHRYGVLFSTIAGLVVYSILYQMGELSPLSAFMAGYMSESVINAAASRVTRKVSGDEYGFYNSGSNEPAFDNKGEDYYDWYARDAKGKARRQRDEVPSDSDDPNS